MKTRNESWDIFRGFAILLVVLGHLVLTKKISGVVDYTSVLVDLIYVVHIPIFFLISGYFSFNSINKCSLKKNIVNKTKGLLLPWFSWSLVAVVLNCAKKILAGGVDTNYIIGKFSEVFITSMSLWFLWALWVIFTIVYFACSLFKKYASSKWHGNWFWVIFFVVIILLPNTKIMFLHKIKLNSIWFAAGYFLHYVNMESRVFKNITLVGILYLPLYYLVFHGIITSQEFFAYYNLEFSSFQFGRGMMVFAISLVYTLLGVAFVWRYIVPLIEKIRLGKIFARVGRYTMEIYMIHMMFVSYALFVPGLVAQNLAFTVLVYMPIYAMLICLFIEFVSRRLLNKIPPYKVLMLGRF